MTCRHSGGFHEALAVISRRPDRVRHDHRPARRKQKRRRGWRSAAASLFAEGSSTNDPAPVCAAAEWGICSCRVADCTRRRDKGIFCCRVADYARRRDKRARFSLAHDPRKPASTFRGSCANQNGRRCRRPSFLCCRVADYARRHDKQDTFIVMRTFRSWQTWQ